MSKQLTVVPTTEEFNILQMMAKTAADSKYFEKLGGFAGIFSIALYAREIGIAPMTAIMGGLQNIMGKITMSSEMMNNLIRQRGHKLEILESTDKICRIKGIRKDTGESYIATFTIDDARKAALIKPNGGYDKYADDMLFARCISKLRRRLFPDIASRSYVHGEIEDTSNETENILEEKIVDISLQENKNISCEESRLSVDQIKEIESYLTDKEGYRQKILDFYKASSFEEISSREFEVILPKIKKRINENQ